MRNKVLVLAILFHLSYAMEEQSSSGYLIHGTMINLKKTCISNVICEGSWSNNMVILGENQQRRLCNDEMYYWKVGKSFLFHPRESRIYIKGKSDDSASEDEEYKSLNHYKDRNMGEYALSRKISCPILRIAEPLISAEKLENGSIDFRYVTDYTNENQEVLPICLQGKKALKKASMDLKRCYKKVLQRAWKELDKAGIKNKYIALDALSTQVGFPREEATSVAVKAILEFLKQNPGKYARIELYVKKRSEFAAYKLLLNTYEEAEQQKRDSSRVV